MFAHPYFERSLVVDVPSGLTTILAHARDRPIRECSDFLQDSSQRDDLAQALFKVLAIAEPRQTEIWRVVWACVHVATEDSISLELRSQIRLRQSSDRFGEEKLQSVSSALLSTVPKLTTFIAVRFEPSNLAHTRNGPMNFAHNLPLLVGTVGVAFGSKIW
jgi:hypothetical protein